MLAALDRKLLLLMRRRLHQPPIERPMRALGLAAEHGAIWLAGGLAASGLDRGRREQWLRAGALAPAAVGANFVVKLIVRRRRPELPPDLPPIGSAPSSLSFPSAHATSSFAAATAMGRLAPSARGPLLALATLIALGRPYLGKHHPSDVLAGAVLGTAIGKLVPLGPPGTTVIEQRLMALAGDGAGPPNRGAGVGAADPGSGAFSPTEPIEPGARLGGVHAPGPASGAPSEDT